MSKAKSKVDCCGFHDLYFVHVNNFPGYAIYYVVASGCSCRGACTPSQDQREEEIQPEEQMAMVEKPEREMGGKTSGVYPALP